MSTLINLYTTTTQKYKKHIFTPIIYKKYKNNKDKS